MMIMMMTRHFLLLVMTMLMLGVVHGFSSSLKKKSTTTTTPTTTTTCRRTTTARPTSSSLYMGARENEIRRKIQQLKREGRLQKQNSENYNDDNDEEEDASNTTTTNNNSHNALEKMQQPRRRRQTLAATDDNYYRDKLQNKLGTKLKLMMGINNTNNKNDEGDMDDSDHDDNGNIMESGNGRRVRLGSIPPKEPEEQATTQAYKPPPTNTIFDPSLFENDNDDVQQEEMDEQDLVELVALKLEERKEQRRQEEEEERRMRQAPVASSQTTTTITQTTTTSGVGGAWVEKNETDAVETYQPKTGSWGAFPRPKDISKAYGGGRRVGAGYTKDVPSSSTDEATRERLRRYRERVGIDVASEKDHATEIDEALRIAGYAMQRGMYSAAVSTLEKVTQWCSTNSKVGGKVFLELAMAYEAEGRAQEAITVYSTLTTCRIEEISANAKRLLYGIEAIQFMRNEAKSADFQRQKIRTTFIDTTGLANIAENFDDVWNTAYIDLDSGYYRKLTANVVRSNREARQILLQATRSGQVEHLKIVQALRSTSRHFDSALEKELKRAAPQSVAIMNGKPIVTVVEKESLATVVAGMEDYVLASAEQMLELLDGKWKLQLTADRQGDGVKFDNNSTLQRIDTDRMTFQSSGPVSFVKVVQSGSVDFDEDRRILSRSSVETSGGGLLSSFLVGKNGGVAAAQQILSVDSVLLITRLAPDKRRASDDGKGFFSVWRRVGPPVFTDREE